MQHRVDQFDRRGIGIFLRDLAVLDITLVILESFNLEHLRFERVITRRNGEALRHRADQGINNVAIDVVAQMTKLIGPGGAPQFIVDLFILQNGIELRLRHIDMLQQYIVKCGSRFISHDLSLAVHEAGYFRERPDLLHTFLGHDRAFLFGQEPRGHTGPVRIGRGGFEVHDLLFRLAQVVAGLRENPLQKMAIAGKFRMVKEALLVFDLDARDAQIKELAVILDLLAECFDRIEPGLQLGIVLVLLRPEPEVEPFVAVRAEAPLPHLVLVKCLPQHLRILKIVCSVLPGIDELVTFPLHLFSVLCHARIIIFCEQRCEVP